ncbi:hypothetical protein ACTMS2_28320 [Micromonospora sp. SD12]|uniref:hypothetical protein n=1 Tax=Micromonospora sp. SD12 TaxID=3452216 RepID=UPI003F8C14C8
MPRQSEHSYGANAAPPTKSTLDPGAEPQDEVASLLDRQILELGRRIVDELGGEQASLLSRWAAYRIAELIHIAETATHPDAQREAMAACTELVLRIWQERSNWPEGWPPPAAGGILDALRERSRWQRAAVPNEPEKYTWTSTIPAIIDSLDYERTLWMLAALAEQDPDELESWLQQEGATLGAQERETLSVISEAAKEAPTRLRALLFEDSTGNAGGAAKGDPASRATTVLRALQETTRSRIKIAQQVVIASAGEAEETAKP